MEEVITISKRELQEMIAEAVANKMVKVRKDFGQVAITDEDVRIVNKNHPEVLDLLQKPYRREIGSSIHPIMARNCWDRNIGSDSKIFLTNRLMDKRGIYYHSKQNLYASLIHEQLKSLALSLHGATVIKDLTDDEFQNALETYNEFKNFFLDRYNVRLTKLKQEFPKLQNKKAPDKVGYSKES